MSFVPTCPRCGNLCDPDATICECGARTGVSRYVVTEIEGDFTARDSRSSAATGLSCHVLDTAVCYRIVATFRTEDIANGARATDHLGVLTPWERRERVRGMARAHALTLNAGEA